VAVLSREIPADTAIAMVSAYENYWPLGRQQRYDRGEGGAKSSRTEVEIGSDLHRALGSNLPFRRLSDVVESRTRKVLAAYNNNRMLDAFLSFSRAMAEKTKGDFAKSTEWMQMFIPVKPDFAVAGEIKPEEYAKKIAEYMNKEKADELGISYAKLMSDYADEAISEDDVNLQYIDGKIKFKQTTPKMVNIIFRQRGGSQQFLYVPDPTLFQIFQSNPNLAKDPTLLGELFGVLGSAISPIKRIVTRSLPFSVYNTFYRDARTAMTTGRGSRSLIPFLYVAKGIKALLAIGANKATKAQLDALSESYEVLSSSTVPVDLMDSFRSMAGEGITRKGDKRLRFAEDYSPSVVGWGTASRNWAGAIASTLLKPIDAINWVTFGWWLSPRGEALTRAGAFIDAAEQGYKTEQAVLAADNSTANFHQRSTSPVVGLIDSQAMFFNARLQVGWQFWRQIFHHSPQVRGLAIFKLAYSSAMHAALLASVVLALRALGDDELDEWLDQWLKTENERTDEDKSRMGSLPFMGGLSVRIPFDDGIPGMFDSLGYNTALTMLAGDRTREENIKTASAIVARSTTFGGVEFMSSAINPIVRTILETQINLKLYDKSRIIPEGITNISEPRLQTTPSTPKLYSDVADAIDTIGIRWSPMMIRHVVQNVGLRTVDQAFAYLDGRNSKDASNFPILGQLITREPRGFASQSVKALSEFDAKYASAKREYESAVNSGDKERAQLAGALMLSLAGYRENWRAVERLWTAAKKLKDAGRIEESKAMERMMTETAKRGLRAAAGMAAAMDKGKL
jgi:hypothetical protein